MLCDPEMRSTSTALNSRGEGQLVTQAKDSLNSFLSETSRLLTMTYSNLLLTRTGINSQMAGPRSAIGRAPDS